MWVKQWAHWKPRFLVPTEQKISNWQSVGKSKSKASLWQPCKTQLLPPSEQVLGCLCTTQAFQPCAGKSSWGRTSNPQEDCPSLTDRSRGTQSSTTTSHCQLRQGQLGICFPSLHQVPIDHLYSWVDWSNVSKVSCSRKQLHQSGHTKNQTHNISIGRPISWPLGYAASLKVKRQVWSPTPAVILDDINL